MKMISNCELARKSENELAALFCRASKALARTRRHTPERRNTLASLENIARERAGRMVFRGDP